MTATTPNTDASEAAGLKEPDEVCAPGDHCCCCGPGEPCCDCGTIIPYPSEIDALRRALTDLKAACELADAHEELSTEIDGSLIDAANDALELRYPIIWTKEDVAKLQAHQDDPRNHPYTCGGDRSDFAHHAQADEEGIDPGTLFPTQRGWKCTACDYRQFWAHGVTNIAPPPATPNPPVDDAGVIQGDREAAASVFDRPDWVEQALAGEFDTGHIVQAFRNHRLSSRGPTQHYTDAMRERPTEIGGVKVGMGLYRLHWKSGGSSVAAIGMCENGSWWVAPTNWVAPAVPLRVQEDPEGRVSWAAVERVELLDPEPDLALLVNRYRVALEAIIRCDDEGDGLYDCVDNHEQRYQSADLERVLQSARQALSHSGDRL